MTPLLEVQGLDKTFVLHQQNGTRLPVLRGVSFRVHGGECVALHGPSGSGKSTLLRSLYGNYKADDGQILLRLNGRTLDLCQATPRQILRLRQANLGYVSQFLRVIPRVPTLSLVSEPLRRLGVDPDEADDRAGALLERLNLPRRLWRLAPATFSGGEQQRVNLARGLIVDYPVLLLDEPTAALDADNRKVVIELILQAKARGGAVVGIFHDAEVRAAVSDRLHLMASADG